MGYMLSKSNKQVKEVLSRTMFSGTTVIARGGASLVVDHGDNTVSKITCDEMGYDWLTAPQYGMGALSDDNPYKLPVVIDYDEVGEISINKRMSDGRVKRLDYALKAVRVPKLKKVRISDLSYDQVVRYRALKDLFDHARQIQYTPDTANYFHKQAESWIAKHPDDHHFEELLHAVYYMCADYHARPDLLTRCNILVYKDHISLVDPVFDPLMWANMRGAYSHPFDTPQGNKNAAKKLVQA